MGTEDELQIRLAPTRRLRYSCVCSMLGPNFGQRYVPFTYYV